MVPQSTVVFDTSSVVIPGLGPGIHEFAAVEAKLVDARP
jgi:hypothetical protein